jgi:hypothetical protein
MAQTTILPLGTSVLPSTNIVVAPGATATVGLFVAAGGLIPRNCDFKIYQVTPGAPILLAALHRDYPQVICGPGTYYVQRDNPGNATGVGGTPVAVGVFLES